MIFTERMAIVPKPFLPSSAAIAGTGDVPLNQIAENFRSSNATSHTRLKRADNEDGARLG